MPGAILFWKDNVVFLPEIDDSLWLYQTLHQIYSPQDATK
jgi:hypothetical protein